MQEASESLMATAVKEAVEQEDLKDAELSDAHIESTDPLRLHIIFDLGPLVEVADYSDIRVPVETTEVTDADVETHARPPAPPRRRVARPAGASPRPRWRPRDRRPGDLHHRRPRARDDRHGPDAGAER